MTFDYSDRRFKTISNTPNGETNSETLFHYRQEGDIVWATYKGGTIIFGILLARTDEQGRLDMRYQQLNSDDQ
jgi:hypothetical protein